MMQFVYVLRSEKEGRFYVGMTENIKRRIKEHNNGKSKSTKGYTPWILFFCEEYETRELVRKEKFI